MQVFHNAPKTSSTLISKSVAEDGGKTDYRGQDSLWPEQCWFQGLILSAILFSWMVSLAPYHSFNKSIIPI